MKNLLLPILLVFAYLSSSAQYEQISGKPCYFERYRAGDEKCTTIVPTLKKESNEGTNSITVFDDENDTLMHVTFDPTELTDEALTGQVAFGSKYTGYEGPNFYYSEWGLNLSLDFIETKIGDPIMGSTIFNIYFDSGFSNYFSTSFYIKNNSTKEFTTIVPSKYEIENEITTLMYDVVTDIQHKNCTPPQLELFYSDSLFYDNDGKLTKRKRNNISGGNTFDFISYYKYQDDGDIELFVQVDSDNDTSQIEKRFFNDNDQAYKIERTNYNPFINTKSTFEISYNQFNKVTEIKKTTVDRIDGDTSDTEKETFEYDASGNWVSYIKVDKSGYKAEQQYVTEVLGNNTYKHTDVDLNIFRDGYDTTYHQTTFLESRFKEFNRQFTTLNVLIFDKNGTVLTSGKNKFNSFDQLTYSEGLDHEVSPISKFLSDSIVYDYRANDDLLKRTVYRWNNSQQKYQLNSENRYFCHGETVGDFLAVNENIDFTFELFPNPSSDIIYIESTQENLSLEAYSMDGQLVKESDSDQMDLSDLNNGIYVLKVSSDNLTKSVKIVKN